MKINSLVDELQDLINSKKLLDRILVYYDVYSGQFEKIPDCEYGFQSMSNPTLNQDIRHYMKFDDAK